MIEVTIYNNGFEIKGHSVINICEATSILAWATSNMISRLDETSKYYASAIFVKNNGYTCFEYDNSNEKAKWICEQFAYNLKLWSKELWGNEVTIQTKNENFTYPFSDEVEKATRLNNW